MPVFTYQSFNAHSGKTHDLRSVTAQTFTVTAHKHWSALNGTDPTALVYPTAGEPNLDAMRERDPDFQYDPAMRHFRPVYGPANLVPTAPADTISRAAVTTDTFLEMMQNKILQGRQALYREWKLMADVSAFGELDSTHADFAGLPAFAGQHAGSSKDIPMACQNFSVFSNNSGNVKHLGFDKGWYAIEYLGHVVVFVHVPNDIAKGNHDRVVKFYNGIVNALNGKVIDVVMGDTNQGSRATTPKALTDATGFPFRDAQAAGKFALIDTDGVRVGGTSSKHTEMFDVAVYNTHTVTIEKVCYWSQQTPFGDGRQVAAVTDHMGLAIKVEKLAAMQG